MPSIVSAPPPGERPCYFLPQCRARVNEESSPTAIPHLCLSGRVGLWALCFRDPGVSHEAGFSTPCWDMPAAAMDRQAESPRRARSLTRALRPDAVGRSNACAARFRRFLTMCTWKKVEN